ncbi:MAG TPA: MbnH family di-heme enzyme [Polyangiales bacterium]|nr:MbnH family di-heme enzyme [Polyangiales bacterium]
MNLLARTALSLFALAACGRAPPSVLAELPPAPAPEVNPTTPEKAELGRHLFYDVRLSQQRNVSCASCHQQAHAFSDTVSLSVGTTGARTARNSMSLVNSGYAATLTWFNPILHDLEAQALVPLVGEAPIELGMANRDDLLRARLLSEPRYRELFTAAFPDQAEPYTMQNVAAALASFQRTLVSTRAPYDQHTLSDAAQQGLALFESERLGCTSCHGGVFFSSAMSAQDARPHFENNGLRADYPPGHEGLRELTGNANDLGKYKPPSLRNVALTAPYMHDGSLATLDEVLEHYARGGLPSATRSPHVKGFALSAEERASLLAFFDSLTDEALLRDPRFADPWSGLQLAVGQ